MKLKKAYKLTKIFNSILEEYIIDKCLFYSDNGKRHVDKETVNDLIGKLLKEVDNVFKYGKTSNPFY